MRRVLGRLAALVLAYFVGAMIGATSLTPAAPVADAPVVEVTGS